MLLNAFSLNMLPIGYSGSVSIRPAALDEARAALATGGSAVGHADTAAVFGAVLGVPVPAVRATVALHPGQTVVVGQYRGQRLPEGATALPDGAAIDFVSVTV